MIVTIDVSGVAQILFKKEKVNKFKDVIDRADLVIAPDLFIPELTNTLWKYHKAKIFGEDECIHYIEDGINLIDSFIDSNNFWKEAFGEGIKNNHPIYDMYYAVIARRNNGILITNDNDLSKICKKLSIQYIY
ncbi:MAG: type II toxin-antitoxin system VapC family toxin [Treponema sp.]|jgi:predicted nucleic acid-binding protein|nr:type II toxin-antitoxin system VapC family toxin [Treponema sp.]